MISAPAATLNRPVASASATCGRRAGSISPVSDIPGAVASPTVTSLIASGTDAPVVAEISFAAVR